MGQIHNFEKPSLSPQIAALREVALFRTDWDWHHLPDYPSRAVPTVPLIDAASWREHTSEEDWLIWRARRTANRLTQMPIEISSGERILGRPVLRPPTALESAEIKSVREVLNTIPPFPGGDAAHFTPDFETLFKLGIRGILNEIKSRRRKTRSASKRRFYDACEIVMKGLSTFVSRVADACEDAEIASICRKITLEPPSTFHEAIELMFLTIVALWFGEDHLMTVPGRMDQTLLPFYMADLASGSLTCEEALELICCLYIQINMLMPPGLAASVLVGGRDQNGKDVTSDLTYLCLEARAATRLAYPTVGLAWHENTPPELMDFACEMLATGIGDPAFFNDELIPAGLREHGVPEADSYNYMNSTCVEIKVAGASNIWVAFPIFNCPQVVLEVMKEIAVGNAPEPDDFTEFAQLVKDRISKMVKDAAEEMNRIWRERAATGCFPLASCFTNDCLEKGEDIDRGGARYNWVETMFVGLANLADSLGAIKKLVYEDRELTLGQFKAVLEADYEGHEALRLRILTAIPKYGVDDDETDALAVEFADFLQDTTESNIVGPHRYVPGFFSWILHGVFGSKTGATPDGRKAGLALADGAGAAQGREIAGPTASLLSTTKWSHKRALGGLVQNLRLSDNIPSSLHGLSAMRNLIETYLRRGGFEIQVNIVSSKLLREAQANPENYRDLLVRVAGYSDYFTHLDPVIQNEIIARTEHEVG